RSTAAKPPVYPLLVALVFSSFGIKNFLALFAAHALLAALICSLLFIAIAKYSYNTAIIASLAFALYPPFIYHSVNTPESTTVIMFLISLFCYQLVRLHERFSQDRWVLAFITSGLLALTEPVTIPFTSFSFLYIAYVIFSSWKKIFAQIIIGVCIF